MKELFKKNTFFLIPYLLFLLIGGIILYLYSKEETHLYINQHHFTSANYFFYYITYLGDGWIIPLVLVVATFFSYRSVLIIGISYSMSSVITQLLKRTIFDNALRPVKFFEHMHDLYLVPGIENHMYNSFPSGHATTAFSLYLALAMMSQKNYLKITLFLLALIASFSRVYLSQHFFNDIYAGSIIGSITTFLVVYFFTYSAKINSQSWIDRSFLKTAN